MATTRATRTNLGAENPTNLGKSALDAKAGITTRGRVALGEVGNVNRQQNAKAGQKPMSKPGRALGLGLSRQKATSNLPTEVIRVTRSKSSLPLEDEKPMEEMVEAMDIDADVIKITSSDLKIDDIDADDGGNPQMATDYVNEIYAYMRQLEAQQNVRENYLELLALESPGKKVVIKPKMRNLLVDWLVEVHMQFSLLQETLYMTVAVLDRFLQEKACDITTKQLQLVGIASMFIASKYEEMYPPEIGDFVYISDHTYSASQIRKMEIMIMATLDFDLGRPLPLNFLRRNSKAGFVDATTHGLAKYVMELSVVEYKLAHIAPSLLSAASLAFSMRALAPKDEDFSLVDLWSSTLSHYSAYTVDDLAPVVSEIAEVVYQVSTDEEAQSGKKKLRAVFKKYANKKFMKIAMLPELKSDLVKRMSQGEI